MILLGYDGNNSKIYRCLDKSSDKNFISRDVIFMKPSEENHHENEFTFKSEEKHNDESEDNVSSDSSPSDNTSDLSNSSSNDSIYNDSDKDESINKIIEIKQRSTT